MLVAVRTVKYSEGLALQLNSVYYGMFTALPYILWYVTALVENCTVNSQACLMVP